VKEIDETDPTESESEVQIEMDFANLLNQVAGLMFEIDKLKERVTKAEVELADLHHGRRISRAQADQTDPEWH